MFFLSDIIEIIACKKALKWGMKKRRKRTRIKGEGGERRLFKPSAFPADLFTNIGERTAGTERVFSRNNSHGSTGLTTPLGGINNSFHL